MAEKVAKLGVEREKDFMYYVKDGEVWKVQRKQPGVPKGARRRSPTVDSNDTNYIYFVDRDGDVARAKRAVGGQKRKKKAAPPRRQRPRPRRRAPARRRKKVVKKKGGAKKKAAPKKKAGKKKGRR